MSNQPNNAAKNVAVIHIGQLPERSWAQQAACLGHNPNLWFLEERSGSYAEARAICQTCPVRNPCLEWALDTSTYYGMWGGYNPIERRRLRRRRQLHFDDIDPHSQNRLGPSLNRYL